MGVDRTGAGRRLRATGLAVLAVVVSGCGGPESALLTSGPVPEPSSPSTLATPATIAPPSASVRASPPASVAAPSPTGGRTAGPSTRPSTRAGSTRVVGTGTPSSCTSAAVVSAVAAGGVVTFDCGPDPVTIRMAETAKVNNRNPSLVLDGGGLVTLSGGGSRRILYQNTCDPAQQWTTDHCDDQETPSLVVENITFADGNSSGESAEGGGGGAIFVRGGQLSVVDSTFVGNRCDWAGPDVGGAAVRVLDQYRDQPVTVSGSTFTSGSCANGGALSSIGVSWRITGSTFRRNVATGKGANPARAGTPGGGSGGAIYLDGNRFTLDLRMSVIEDNTAAEGGGAIFFVSNDRTGTATLTGSTLRRNPSKGFETERLPGIFFLGAARPTLAGGTVLQ